MAFGMGLVNDVGWHIRNNDLPGAAALLRAGVARLRSGAVQVPASSYPIAVAALNQHDHGSPMWRLAVLVASGCVTREDLRILAEVVEALADGLPMRLRPRRPV